MRVLMSLHVSHKSCIGTAQSSEADLDEVRARIHMPSQADDRDEWTVRGGVLL